MKLNYKYEMVQSLTIILSYLLNLTMNKTISTKIDSTYKIHSKLQKARKQNINTTKYNEK